MKHRKTITLLAMLIMIASVVAAVGGIFSGSGTGSFMYESIRGEQVEIYGKGIYRHMPAEVAPQGIAQDYVTLFVGVPLLLISLIWFRSGSLRGRFFIAGILMYFFVTYLFYLTMGMYNVFFLLYAFLLGTSFFGLLLALLSIDVFRLKDRLSKKTPVKYAGGFLIFNGLAIALMWLGIVIPPLIEGSLYPPDLFHFTTLIVQGLDLGLLLPLSFVSGWLLWKRHSLGLLAGPVYFVFLSLLMLALTAKIIALGMLGYEIIPAIFIIPAITLIAIAGSVVLLSSVRADKT